MTESSWLNVQSWEKLKSHIKNLMKEHVPTKSVFGHFHLPWLPPLLKRIVKKGRLYRKAKKKRSWWNHYREFEHSTKWTLKQANWQYVKGIHTSDLEEGYSKPIWRYIKSMRQDSHGISPLKSGTHLLTALYHMAQLLSDQFSSVFTDDNTPEMDNMLHGLQCPQSDPWKCQNLEFVSSSGTWTPGKQQGLMRLQPKSWRNS